MINMAEPLARLVATGQADCAKSLHSFTTLAEVNDFRAELSRLHAMDSDKMRLIMARQDEVHRK